MKTSEDRQLTLDFQPLSLWVPVLVSCNMANTLRISPDRILAIEKGVKIPALNLDIPR